MKIKSILAVGAMSLGLAGMAHAATNLVYITGSTAFRGAIYDTLATNTFDSAPAIVATKCSTIGTLNPHTAGQMMFQGSIGTNFFIVKATWSGSEAGIADLCSSHNAGAETFIATTTTPQTNTMTLTQSDSHTVDLALADTDQSVALTQTPSLAGTNCGIIPFIFVKNAQTNGTTITTAPSEWNNIQNVTSAQLRVLLSGGSPGALLTGNPADTNYVYIAGRDNQSGTFVNTMEVSGFGLVNNPSQIEIGSTNGGYAYIIPPGLLSGPGKNVEGQNSGGTLSTTMTYAGSGTNDDIIADGLGIPNSGWYAIAYLGLPDADVCLGIQGAVAAPAGVASKLTFNGVAESTANIENGTYAFFGNEWLYESANNFGASGNAGTIYNKLATKIPAACDDTYYIKVADMLANKANSSSDPTHN